MECYNANPSWIMFNGQKIWQSRFCVLCRYLSSHNGVPRQLSVWSQCSLKIGWFFTGISVFLFLYSWLSCTFKKEYLFEEDEVYANFKLDFFFLIIVPEVFDHNFFFEKGIFAYEWKGVHTLVKNMPRYRIFASLLLNHPHQYTYNPLPSMMNLHKYDIYLYSEALKL